MTIKIKKISYLIPPRDMLNDALDVIVELEENSDEFGYVVEVTTPQFLSTLMEKEKSTFLSPDYPCIIVSKLTDDIIQAAIESFINPKDSENIYEELFWLKLYHLIPSLTIEDVNELYDRKKQQAIKWEADVDAELEAESDSKN